MTDYSSDVELVRKMILIASIRGVLRGPASIAAGMMRSGVARGVVGAIGGASENTLANQALDLIWRHKYSAEPAREISPLIRAMWESSTETLGTLTAYACHYEYRVVFGIPIGSQLSHRRGWSHCPVDDETVLALARGENWVFGKSEGEPLSMEQDSQLEGVVMDERTQRVIDDIRSMPGCRAHMLWGPPRAGKSVAAKQIAQAVAGSWVRICGKAGTSEDVWRGVAVLRPAGIIIDDIDVNAGSESPLMAGLERAREWARVIISTANVVPSVDGERGDKLRGAVIGRASDGALIEYRELSDEVRRKIAPDVSTDLDTSDLLAQHQVELQRRATAPGRTVTQADVDEMRELQALIGDR